MQYPINMSSKTSHCLSEINLEENDPDEVSEAAIEEAHS